MLYFQTYLLITGNFSHMHMLSWKRTWSVGCPRIEWATGHGPYEPPYAQKMGLLRYENGQPVWLLSINMFQKIRHSDCGTATKCIRNMCLFIECYLHTYIRKAISFYPFSNQVLTAIVKCAKNQIHVIDKLLKIDDAVKDGKVRNQYI